MQTPLLYVYLSAQLSHAASQLARIHPLGDPEALHRYRVALRRCRSLIALYLPEEEAFDAVLKQLHKSTAALRMIDVFTAETDPARFPRLHRSLVHYRRELYDTGWNAETLRHHLNALHRLLSDLDPSDTDLPPGILVTGALRRYRRAVAARRKLHRGSPPKTVHRARLRCKEARYALEFLEKSGLAAAGKRIAKCKKALARYGEIQDAADQLAFLERFCESHPSGECRKLYAERKKRLKKLKKKLMPA